MADRNSQRVNHHPPGNSFQVPRGSAPPQNVLRNTAGIPSATYIDQLEGHRDWPGEDVIPPADYQEPPGNLAGPYAHPIGSVEHAQGIHEHVQDIFPENRGNEFIGYVPQGVVPGSTQAAFAGPSPSTHRAPALGQPATENLRRLASRYVHHPDSQVDTVRMEQGSAGRYKVVIVLEMVDFL